MKDSDFLPDSGKEPVLAPAEEQDSEKKPMFTRKELLQLIGAFVLCFAVGCAGAFWLSAYDRTHDNPAAIENGQTADFSEYGFRITVPAEWSLVDFTTDNSAAGDTALFAGCMGAGDDSVNLFIYANEAGDSISDYKLKPLIVYYTDAGAADVREYHFGGKRFIYYRAIVDADGEVQTWDTYESWNPAFHIRFETRMEPDSILPALTSIEFTGAAETALPEASASPEPASDLIGPVQEPAS